ncbi:immune-associated nucleotide-binding protein 13-like isoform X2 [Parambassis ranga]|uniref:Immune-associated nucleotide-binding protein 13-like isoform X2 n=1 Tax=Parambassis ranga TaxID=210632 RepID=A0A6P7K1N6_9TELE|nr:immune-associated nucleotide-binding protein 13-like isoform X2 [Parambassis ranga]
MQAFLKFFKGSDGPKQSNLLQEGPPDIYKIPLKEEKIKGKGCKRFSFGKEPHKPNRTIMVMGATGAGKSTLINGMINYILGVKWEDSYRFKLVDEGQSTSQAHSQTSEVTVYKINHQVGFTEPFSLTIIDTPGFGDTRGIDRDKLITEQLRNLFSDPHGVSEIDAVCFVVQASLARLTPSQKYVFDSVLSIFGKDVAENIRVLVTFADGQCPPVLEAITESDVPCPKTKAGLPVHFKFNNSALFAHNNPSEAKSTGGDDDDDDDDDDGGSFDKMFWDMGTSSMKKFFAALTKIKTKSLTLTQQVLRERQQLEVSVDNLQLQVKFGLAKLEEIKETSEKLKEHEAEISRNENVHHNQKYRFWYEDVTEKRTIQDLKEKYEEAKGEKLTVQGVIDRLKAEYDDVQAEVVRLMETSAECLNRLKEIALKPNPLSTPEYIDMLIEGEKSEAKPGWNQRVQSLISMRQKAEYMARVERGEKLLDHQESLDSASPQ